MKKIFSEAHQEFFSAFVPGHTDCEVAEEFSRRFGLKITPTMVKNYKNRYRLKSGTPRGKPKGFSKLFPREVLDFIRENNTGKTAAEMRDLLNRTFGREYSLQQIKNIRNRMHLDSGLTGHFEQGNVPYNKGKKGTC